MEKKERTSVSLKTVNERQKEFYGNFKKNRVTKFWYGLRNGLLRNIRKNIGAETQIYNLHKEWFGDLSNKKVLDLGCYAGNSLSYYLAENSLSYLGIDLSEKAINTLNVKLKNLEHAEARAVDFLSNDFQEKDFDLIYAYGVLHHFEDVDFLINKLNEKLNDQGTVISYDPLKTDLLVKVARGIYRPFQSDKDWEWPFSKQTYYKFAQAFQVKDRRGMLGKAKWFFLLDFLPIPNIKKKEIGKKWHQKDWENSKLSDAYLFKCLHITMLMQKKET